MLPEAEDLTRIRGIGKTAAEDGRGGEDGVGWEGCLGSEARLSLRTTICCCQKNGRSGDE